MAAKPTFYEFFAGGGMARAGLGKEWQCLFANDFDPKKVVAYKANWGEKEIVEGDIYKLKTSQLPGQADLAWASFPCQDLSLAGNGAGLKGERSGTFWGFYEIIQKLKVERRAPKMLVLENVVGILTSNGGEDFVEVCRALAALDYDFGAMVIDAVHFVPQSRPRFFMLAVRKGAVNAPKSAPTPTEWTTPKALVAAHSRLRPDLQAKWRWWKLPRPRKSNVTLASLIEDNPADVAWHTPQETARLVAMMSPIDIIKLNNKLRCSERRVGTIYRRMRSNNQGVPEQRAELRVDGVSGCLRTPAGGSSRQMVIIIDGSLIRTRLISINEAASIMGLSKRFELPKDYTDAYRLIGDGVSPKVVTHFRKHLLLI